MLPGTKLYGARGYICKENTVFFSLPGKAETEGESICKTCKLYIYGTLLTKSCKEVIRIATPVAWVNTFLRNVPITDTIFIAHDAQENTHITVQAQLLIFHSM
jgi:hypothetical protein